MITVKLSKKIKNYFALGFGGEVVSISDEEKHDHNNVYPLYHIKIFLGTRVLLIDIHKKQEKK